LDRSKRKIVDRLTREALPQLFFKKAFCWEKTAWRLFINT
jgi:hypothetical protein